jgi:hypothetical protein
MTNSILALIGGLAVTEKSEKVAVGADHFGLALKNLVRDHLRKMG